MAKDDIKATGENVTQALINIQTKLKPLQANVEGHHGKFANLTQVMDALKPHLDTEKLAIIQLPVASTSGACTLETRLRHAPTGEEIVSQITIPTQRANDPQAYGAAMTYGRRYSLLCLFGMVTEDDDAQGASMNLERLLRELSGATDINELGEIKDRHFNAKHLKDRFWNTVYNILYEKKYNSLMAMDQRKG